MLPNLFQRNMLFNMLLLFCLVNSEETNCTGKKCCEGYMWNPNSTSCEKCPSGYIGPTCSKQCPYPAYGDGCQGECKCREDECDFLTGCNIQITVTQGSTVLGIYNKNSKHYNTDEITTIQYEDTTTANLSSSGSNSQDLNTKLLNLIKVFGGVSIILICIHLCILIYDQRSKRKLIHADEVNEQLDRNNGLYENVEIFFL